MSHATDHSVPPQSDLDDPPTPLSGKFVSQENVCQKLQEKLAVIRKERDSVLQTLEEKIRSEREDVSARYEEKIRNIARTIELLEEDRK